MRNTFTFIQPGWNLSTDSWNLGRTKIQRSSSLPSAQFQKYVMTSLLHFAQNLSYENLSYERYTSIQFYPIPWKTPLVQKRYSLNGKNGISYSRWLEVQIRVNQPISIFKARGVLLIRCKEVDSKCLQMTGKPTEFDMTHTHRNKKKWTWDKELFIAQGWLDNLTKYK